MKLSKMKYIGIAILCIVIAGGLYGWQQYRTTEVTQEIIMSMCPFMPEQINRIEIHSKELTTFVKQEKWLNEEEKKLSYDQQIMESLVSQISTLSTTRIIKNVQDLSVYGINDQSVQITVYNDLNEGQSYKIGQRLPQENAHYIWHVEKEILGVVPDVQMASILVPPNQMIDEAINWEGLDGSTTWSIRKNGEVMLEWLKEGEAWLITEPYENQYILDKEAWNKYFEGLRKLTKEAYVGTVDKQVYGLEQPVYVLEREGQPYITIGSEVGGMHYMTYKEEPYVYTVNSELVKPILKVDAFNWINRQIVDMPQEVTQIEVVLGEEVIVFNQKNLEVAKVELSKLAYHSPIANAAIEKNNPRHAEITIRLMNGEEVIDTVEFVPYDPSFYLIRKNENVEFSAEKKPIIEVIKALRLLVNEEADNNTDTVSNSVDEAKEENTQEE